MRAVLAGFLTVGFGLAVPKPEECRSLKLHGQREKADSCFLELAGSSSAFLRAEGLYGLRRYSEAHAQFKIAHAAEPKSAGLKVRWGRLLIEPFNKNRQDGADLFQEALEINEFHAGALFGMALVASDSFESRAAELARKALESDPKLVEAQELLAQLALEDVNFTKAIEEADKAIKMSPDALDALAVRAAVNVLEDKSAAEWLDRINKINPYYAGAQVILGHHLVLNRRYEEGIERYREAIRLDPEHWVAHSLLGINLMRLGKDEEAKKYLSIAFDNGVRENPTVNSLRLIESYKNFVTFTTPATILRLHRKESDVLRVYFEDELTKAVDTYSSKYRMKLPGPVQLEVYPDHDDLQVRTTGMPGIGLLGVTFGRVVAMDSPSGRKPGQFHWASTLWHELSHVFVLTATNHRVPRWFTEGVAVHEETAINADWGDRLTPELVMAIKDKKLLPVNELDRGFVRPTYPNQVIVSYYQAGKICDFITEKYGFEKILAMMQAYAARKNTAQVIEDVLGVKPEEFDKRFLAWHDGLTKTTVASFDEWRKKLKKAAGLSKEKKYDDAIREGEEAVKLYPEYVEAANAYEIVAEGALAKGDKGKAIDTLARYAKIGGRSPDTLKKLAGLQEEVGDKKAAAATLARINYIYPVNDEALHRKLGDLYLSLDNMPGAIREYRAWVAMKPIDKASANFQLAKAYLADRQQDKAEEHLLESLEAAPGFRPAQKMLLELNAQKKEKR
jgi:tetratricopeptide (TPR) repeat protein